MTAALIQSCKTFDAFNGCLFDFTKIPQLEPKAVKHVLPSLLDELQDKHVVSIKMQHAQAARIVKYASQNGFFFHHATPDEVLMTRCCLGHTHSSCSYPKFVTASVGVTGVVFDQKLEHVLLIREKWGGVKDMKPPTGSVDYLEAGEHPLQAVVRELKEETNIEVNLADAVLVANTWTQKLRGNSPDINFIFAYKSSSNADLTFHEDEITEGGWHSVEKYTDQADSYVMKQIVKAAKRALEHQKQWTAQACFWSDGKPVTLFSF